MTIAGGRRRTVSSLLGKGAGISVTDTAGCTPLLLTAASENKALIQLLLEKGANLPATGNLKHTTLHIATLEGRQENVEIPPKSNKSQSVVEGWLNPSTNCPCVKGGGCGDVLRLLNMAFGVVRLNSRYVLHFLFVLGFFSLM